MTTQRTLLLLASLFLFQTAAAEIVVQKDLERSGQLNGTPAFDASRVSDQTLVVSATGQGVEHPHSDAISAVDGDFAFAFWYRPQQDHTGAWRVVTFKGNTSAERNFSIWMRPNDNRVHYRLSTTATFNDGGDSASELILNQWHHIAYVKEGNQLKLFINGRLDATDALGGAAVVNDGPLYIGSTPWHASALGELAHVNVYQRTITALEARSLYLSEFTEFNLEEQGVAQGSPSYTSGTVVDAQALQINSADDGVVLPNSVNLKPGTADFSVGFWFRLEANQSGTWRALLRKAAAGTEQTFGLWLHPDSNRLRFRISTDQQANTVGDSNGALTVGEWTHIAYVKHQGTLRLYLNGVQDTAITVTGNVQENNGPLYIGANPWDTPALGSFDQLSVYNYRLIAADIARAVNQARMTPAVGGSWGPVIPWPHVAVSAANLPDGKILTWSGSERTTWPRDEQTYSSTWDPETNTFFELFHEGHNMFCAHLAMTEEGQVFVTGGRNQTNSPWTSLFDYRDNQWHQIENMATGGRWYPVTMALPSGHMMTSMGTATNFANPETWNPSNGWQVLNNVDYSAMRQSNDGTAGSRRWWPTLTVTPSGEVLHFWTQDESHLIDTSGTGAVRDAQISSNHADPAPGVYVQYDAGKLLVSGSNQGSWGPAATRDQTYTVDMNGPSPAIETAADMSSRRTFHNLVPLPNGEVIAIGGSEYSGAFNNRGAVYEAEIWDPSTRNWRLTNPMAVPRTYHSTALLLTDGRVLAAGGGYGSNNEFIDGASHSSGQIYSPPYLFNADGSAADRPTLTTGPGVVRPGDAFTVTASNDVSSFSMVKMSSTTHAVNTDARFHWLDASNNGDGTHTLTANGNINVLIPGYWMLFAVNTAGVPSIAQVVKVERPGNATTPGDIRYVRLIAQSEVNGMPWTSAAEIDVLDANGDPIDSSGWVVAVNSQESDGPATYAVDDDLSTIWHTQWRAEPGNDNDPAHPHQFTIDLGTGYALSGLTYQTRQDTSFNGSIAAYTVLLSSDGNTWQTASSGTFSAVRTLQTATFGAANPGSAQLQMAAPASSGSAAQFSVSGDAGLEYKWSFGDGSAETDYSSNGTIAHQYDAPGRYNVVLTVRDALTGETLQLNQTRIVYDDRIDPANGARHLTSSTVGYHPTRNEIWSVNPDNNSVSVIATGSNTRLAEINVGARPSALAFASTGEVWVTNRSAGTISVINATNRTVQRTIALPNGNSAPHGLVISGNRAYVTLGATGQLLALNTANGNVLTSRTLGADPRHLAISADGTTLYVLDFVTAPLAGEHTANPDTSSGVPAVYQVRSSDLTLLSTIALQHSNDATTENTGPGLPNYLGTPALHPAGDVLYVPSKQDNILGGVLRGGILSFDQAVRAVSSRIELDSGAEALSARIDHDNASVASAAIYGPYGLHLFTALEGNRQIAVSDTLTGTEIVRLNVGRAPQGLALSTDGKTLAVQNFMDRSVQQIDISDIVDFGASTASTSAATSTVASETLSTEVLAGKRLFYDAQDDRLAALDYMSCASCHADGEQDGRVWDFTQFGEGLRNTITLNGTGGMAHGLLHWTGNFDELQDFEGQIRAFAGGTGLMSDAEFLTGTRADPMGDSKAGVSDDLDALAAYLTSLNLSTGNPAAESALSSSAARGADLFAANQCASCHSDARTTDSPTGVRHDIGTLSSASGMRLGGSLDGLDTPTLTGLAHTSPYLHDGSATTLQQAIARHTSTALSAGDRDDLAQYLLELPQTDATFEPPAVGDVVTVGVVTVRQPARGTWHSVVFNQSFEAPPVVILSPVSYNGGDPTTVRVRNVTTTGFEFQMQEWDYRDGPHTTETISYIAAPAGAGTLGGLSLQAFTVNADSGWSTVDFASRFDNAPLVFSQVASTNEAAPTVTRMRRITDSRFELRLDEEEAADRQHVSEAIHVIAIETGSGTANGGVVHALRTPDTVTHGWYTANLGVSFSTTYAVAAAMQSTDGGDTATLRVRNLLSNSLQLKVEEEKSREAEVAHTTETVGILLIETTAAP